MDVAIIDYGMSNLHSVKAACDYVGLKSIITSDENQIMEAKMAMLPGVGAFGQAMKHLNNSGMTDCIKNFVASEKPFIGICLGLQLLFEESEEFGANEGLGLISGRVRKFNTFKDDKYYYPVPQIGWNNIKQNEQGWEKTPLKNNFDDDFMYFVHSYFVVPSDKSIVISKTVYGENNYCSAIKYNNIFATQFHPEKSGPTGIKIYKELKSMVK